eukprot:651754-Pelagomonas_calceolata.AAC.1
MLTECEQAGHELPHATTLLAAAREMDERSRHQGPQAELQQLLSSVYLALLWAAASRHRVHVCTALLVHDVLHVHVRCAAAAAAAAVHDVLHMLGRHATAAAQQHDTTILDAPAAPRAVPIMTWWLCTLASSSIVSNCGCSPIMLAAPAVVQLL